MEQTSTTVRMASVARERVAVEKEAETGGADRAAAGAQAKAQAGAWRA